MARRIYLVGTGTGMGKTAVACALLQWSKHHRVRAIPFKPAQSGGETPYTDIHRLLQAASLPTTAISRACPFRFDAPLAPGLAENPFPFFRPPAANHSPRPPTVRHATELLSAWEVEHRPDLVFIEGAGGLHVPMPGGDWQPTWISALAHHVVVVGSLGLGTINHTLLTIDALRNLGLPPLGFYLCEHDPTPDPSHRDNAQIIATARGLSHLGTLRQTSPSDGPGTLDLLTPLLTLLPTSSF